MMELSAKSVSKRLILLATSIFLVSGPPAFSQGFDSDLLSRARAALTMVPGNPPLDVRFQEFIEIFPPLSGYVEGGSDDMVPMVVGVFQIRFSDGWIMVDAGGDREVLFENFSHENYAIIGEALANANMTVVTHAHDDHAGSLVRGPFAESASSRAILTEEQLGFLMAGSNNPKVQISQAHADRFRAVRYDEVLPIAPGVVLIKAAGHTPGSQIVFVELESGKEILLIGDIVWHKAGLDRGAHKGSFVAGIGHAEDREALTAQLRWLKEIRDGGLHVVIAHDWEALEAQFADGVIQHGLHLGEQN
jgi:glyoxylase-like metal-dependent hydrolase (beta-lactamase superfamily II)